MSRARGVLPHREDKVMANPLATGAIATVTLRPDMDAAQVQAWLAEVEQAISALRETLADGSRLATVATGFSPTFFTVNGTQRFPGLDAPAGFSRLPAVPFGTPVAADVVFYVVSLSEGMTARFLHALWDTRPDVTTVHVERGYQRLDESEPFGYRDGVRNVVPKSDRGRTVYVDEDRHAEEPAWAVDGTYLAYLRISQSLDAFDLLDDGLQDRVIGRSRDGSRLDLPAGTDPRTEPAFTGDTCPLDSHVRKTGPRGAGNDTVDIFRRGLPFQELTNGGLVAGLQFVSFQASLDQFDVVFNRWMLNPDFPAPGTGPDALVAQGLVSIERHGFFFVPAETNGSIATTLFKQHAEPGKAKTGRVAVRKRISDPSGLPSLLDLHGIQFQLTTPDGTPVGGVFTTDAAGHALSDEVPTGDYVLTELPPRSPLTPSAPLSVSLHSARAVVTVTNTVPAGTTQYI